MTKPTAIILLLLSIGLFYTFTSPQYEAAKALSLRAAEYRNVIENVERIILSRDNLLRVFESIPQAEVDRLSKVLPNDLDTVSLARDLDTIASQYGIAITDVSVETEDREGATLIALPEGELPYRKAIVSFSFISNYPNFAKFLADLERSLRIMDVRSISFRIGDSSNLYEHKLSVETYWLNN